jgi:acetyltransferase-like isoleucine patch superfamily enzyme/acyl carrier protein
MTAASPTSLERGIARLKRLVEQKRVSFWLRSCEKIGEDCRLEGHPTIMSWPNVRITIGDRFRLSSLPEESHIVAGDGAEIIIGDDVWIGHGSSISANRRVSIGNGTKIAPFVTIMDTDFHVAGDRSAAPASTPIVIGRDVRIGNGVTILRGATIGDGARVEPGAVVSGEIPTGATAGGVPARVQNASTNDGSDDVLHVVMRALGLATPPTREDGPRNLPGWDSLGSLKLLLALEDVFEITLDQDALLRVQSVGDVASIVARAKGTLE